MLRNDKIQRSRRRGELSGYIMIKPCEINWGELEKEWAKRQDEEANRWKWKSKGDESDDKR